METTSRGVSFMVQCWHDLRFGGRSEERCDESDLWPCNVQMDIVLSSQIIWEYYKVYGRLKRFGFVQNRKMWLNGKPSDKWRNILELEWDVFLEGNEKADELAKESASLDGGFWTGIRAQDVRQERREVFATVEYAAFSVANVEEWNSCQKTIKE